jgi:CO/xanthine dehydrogenase FAD-binding subunit
MIVEYNRPGTIQEALDLLARKEPVSVPMGGGSALNRYSLAPLAVVDLQALPLDRILQNSENIELGATVTLQAFYNFIIETPDLPLALHTALLQEANNNLRQVATLAGTLVAGTGRSPLVTVLLALDATLTTLSRTGEDVISLGDFLPARGEYLPGRLITKIQLPRPIRLAFDYVARSPADQPIVCAALAQWPGKRTRLALGGYGLAPVLVLDGLHPEGVEAAAQNAYSQAGDVWASAEYRREVAGILARRCLSELNDLTQDAAHISGSLS